MEYARIIAEWFKTNKGYYLVTLKHGLECPDDGWFDFQSCAARAVVDDFGSLVIVRGWI